MPHVQPFRPELRELDWKSPHAVSELGEKVTDDVLAAAMKDASKADANHDQRIDAEALRDLKVYVDRYEGSSFPIEPLRNALEAATKLPQGGDEIKLEDADIAVRGAIRQAFSAAEQIGKRWP